jgi:hypothetical protein
MTTPNLFDRIVGQRSSLESLMARVPGYSGYKEMTDRRASDRMIRDNLVNKFKALLTELNSADKKLLLAGDLSKATLLSGAKQHFQLLVDKISAAMPGYSGFYDAKKVGPDELAKIYAFDAAMLDYVDKIKTAVTAFDTAVTSKEGLDKAVADVEAIVNEALNAYSLRDDVLSGVSQN